MSRYRRTVPSAYSVGGGFSINFECFPIISHFLYLDFFLQPLIYLLPIYRVSKSSWPFSKKSLKVIISPKRVLKKCNKCEEALTFNTNLFIRFHCAPIRIVIDIIKKQGRKFVLDRLQWKQKLDWLSRVENQLFYLQNYIFRHLIWKNFDLS